MYHNIPSSSFSWAQHLLAILYSVYGLWNQRCTLTFPVFIQCCKNDCSFMKSCFSFLPGIFTRFLLLSSTALGFGGIISSSLIKMYFNRTDWAKYGKKQSNVFEKKFWQNQHLSMQIWSCQFVLLLFIYYVSVLSVFLIRHVIKVMGLLSFVSILY